MTITTPAIVRDPSAAERLSRARQWLAESRPGEELLVLAASQEAASDLIRDCIGPPAGMAVAAFGWHRATLGQLPRVLRESYPQKCEKRLRNWE